MEQSLVSGKQSGLLAVPALQLLVKQWVTQLCKPGVRERAAGHESPSNEVLCSLLQESWDWGLTDAGAALMTNSKWSSQRMALDKDGSRAVEAQAKIWPSHHSLPAWQTPSWAGSKWAHPSHQRKAPSSWSMLVEQDRSRGSARTSSAFCKGEVSVVAH